MKTSELRTNFANLYNANEFIGTGNVNVVSSQLKIDAILGGANYSNITSVNTYDLTSSYAFIELADAGNQALTSYEVYPIFLQLDANNGVFWFVNLGSIAAYKKVGGTSTLIGSSTTYVNATHRFLRIRESNGVVYYEYSPDRKAWVVFQSELVSNLFAITALKIRHEAGVFASEASTTSALLDNLNMSITDFPSTFTKRISPYPFAPRRVR